MILFLDQIFQSMSFTQVLQLIVNYDYIAIFLLMLAESTFIPFPSELVLPFAGYLIAINAMDPVLGFADAVIAALAGSLINYAIGYLLGLKVVLKYGKKFGFEMKAYKLGIKWMKAYGNYFAFISKLLPVVRSAASLVCGAMNMDLKKFTAYTAAGISVWSAVLMYAGYAFAENWEQVYSIISTYLVYITLIIVFSFALISVYVLIYKNRRAKKGAAPRNKLRKIIKREWKPR